MVSAIGEIKRISGEPQLTETFDFYPVEVKRVTSLHLSSDLETDCRPTSSASLHTGSEVVEHSRLLFTSDPRRLSTWIQGLGKVLCRLWNSSNCSLKIVLHGQFCCQSHFCSNPWKIHLGIPRPRSSDVGSVCLWWSRCVFRDWEDDAWCYI